MAGRGNPSFQKRQKEQLRLERRQEKAARKAQRKQEGPQPIFGSVEETQPDDYSQPPDAALLQPE